MHASQVHSSPRLETSVRFTTSKRRESRMAIILFKVALIVLSMTEMFNFVEPCFITNCPRGGKRSGSPLVEDELMTSLELPLNKVTKIRVDK